MDFIKNNFAYTEVVSQNNFIVLYDIIDYSEIEFFIEEKKIIDKINLLYVDYVIDNILMKTKFALNLMFQLKDQKLIKKLKPIKKRGFTKILVRTILFSMLQSCDFNENSFDEFFFCNIIHDKIFDEVTVDYLYIAISNIIKNLKKNEVFFYLKKNRFSIKDNLFFLIFNYCNFDYFVSEKKNKLKTILDLDFFFFNKKLNDYIESNNVNINQSLIFDLLKKLNHNSKLSFFQYNQHCCDYYNIDLFNIDSLIKENRFLISYFNDIFYKKLDINSILFFTTVFVFFDNLFLKKENIKFLELLKD